MPTSEAERAKRATHRLCFYVPVQMKKAVIAKAESQGISVSELVKNMLAEHIRKTK